MKKIFLQLIALLIIFGSGVKKVFAGDAIYESAIGLFITTQSAGLPAGDPYVMVGRLVGYVLSFTSVILVIVVVYGGLSWMTAGGDSEKVSKARRSIIQGVIGLIITLSAYIITYYVLTRLTGQGSVIIEL